jgi:membrane-bound metal-dependent hydrolase YbcI (DUF457 family)
MLFVRAKSSTGASAMLLMMIAIFAESLPAAMCSWMTRQFEPFPEAKIARFNRKLSL